MWGGEQNVAQAARRRRWGSELGLMACHSLAACTAQQRWRVGARGQPGRCAEGVDMSSRFKFRFEGEIGLAARRVCRFLSGTRQPGSNRRRRLSATVSSGKRCHPVPAPTRAAGGSLSRLVPRRSRRRCRRHLTAGSSLTGQSTPRSTSMMHGVNRAPIVDACARVPGGLANAKRNSVGFQKLKLESSLLEGLADGVLAPTAAQWSAYCF